MLRRMPAILWPIVAAIAANAQNGPAVARFSPEEMRADLEILRGAIHQAHPDPYRYRTRTELDRIVDRVKTSCSLPLSVEQFADSAMPIFHAIGDAHTRLEMPVEYTEHLARDVPLIPITVRIIDGEIYLDGELKGFRSVPPGSRILAINGHAASGLLDRFMRLVVADGSDTTFRHRTIEREFATLYHRCMGPSASFDIRFRDPEGLERTERLFAITAEEMRRSMPASEIVAVPWRSVIDEKTGVDWLTLSTLDRSELEAAGIKPQKFIEELSERLRQQDTKTLVIDVRGAGGTDLGVAEQVFKLIAQGPFRVVQQMSVRSASPPEAYAYALPQDEFYASVGANFLPDLNDAHTLRPDDPRLEHVQPSPKAFKGQVYLVQDGLTRDAGATLGMLARRTGRARIVGEECGSNAFSFCGGRELVITAPNTGMRFHIPLTRFVPDGSPSGPVDRGELPDHFAQQEPWGLVRGRDTVKTSLLQLIQELQ
jgi:hypothetical protein